MMYSINNVDYEIEWNEHANKGSIGYDIFLVEYDGSKTHLMHGFVKWDGCSNWNFEGACMLHACTLEGLNYLSELPKFCWIHCSKNLEKFINI